MGRVWEVSVTRPSLTLPARYRVVRHLASGGMAGVWEAHDELLGRDVAVKVLAHHLHEDERARKRFQREARAAAGLSSHPHVVTIYDVGEHDGRSFIVMELMCGGSLAERVKNGPIERRDAMQWLDDAASALDAAHATGMVHRDIKPANLLLDQRDRLGIADFGIARQAFDDQVTQTGQVLGTASYLAPEQALGEPATSASDRYALAVVAFELLTGRRPFPHEHFAAQARAHVEDPPPHASEIDPSLPAATGDVLNRGLAKDPRERWPSSAAFVTALAESLDGAAAARVAPATEPTRRMAPIVAAAAAPEAARAATPPPPPPRRDTRAGGAPRPPHRSNWPVVASLVGLLFAAIVLAAVLGDGGEDTQSTPSGAQERTQADSTPTAEATPEKTAEPTQEPTQEPAQQPDEGAAADLNAQGFQLIGAGRPEEAVAPLRQAYEACQGSEALDPCGYAIFNLGQALRRSGNPGEAVPVLEERLQRFPNDRPELVQHEIDLARAGETGDGRGNGRGRGPNENKDDDEDD
jgi:predicted Ser/Thr protein kinase